MSAAAITSKIDYRALFGALGRLDRILERMVASADAAYGSGASTDPYRGLYVSSDEVRRLLAREPGAPPLTGGTEPSTNDWPELQSLQRQFDLEPFDLDAVLVALAPELDLRYERLYAYLQDDVTKRRPSLDLTLNILCATRDAKLLARMRFAPDAPLVRHHLLHLVPDSSSVQPPLLAYSLKLDDAVLRWLIRQPSLDSRIAAFTRQVRPECRGVPPSSPLAAVEHLAREAVESGRGAGFFFAGPDPGETRHAAESLAASLSAQLLMADLDHIPASDFDELFDRLLRAARLAGAVVFLENLEALSGHDRTAQLYSVERRLRDYSGIAIVAGRGEWVSQSPFLIRVPFVTPDFAARRLVWQAELAAHHIPADATMLDELSSRYRLGSDQIAKASAAAANQAYLESSPPRMAHVAAAARAQTHADLGPLARKIIPLYTWKDIVLPADQIAQLKEICNQARFRHVVYDDWGFDGKLSLGKGLSALFSGPPGTGKTMAAEVLANDLGIDLYKIDLSQVVSKYIGETEKNLNRVFEQARAGNVILFFDECDAMFGKRTEVRDAHDRYANIEVAYLLQKMEEHEGLSILATNLRQNLDPAFMRRLTFAVEFPFPDEASRRCIWEAIWPAGIPLQAGLDLGFMASQFKLAGGAVKNIALSAAFLAAAEQSGAVRIEHLLRATRRELEKSGRSVTRTEFGRYGEQLDIFAGGVIQ